MKLIFCLIIVSISNYFVICDNEKSVLLTSEALKKSIIEDDIILILFCIPG
jgi:hypothetical protein